MTRVLRRKLNSVQCFNNHLRPTTMLTRSSGSVDVPFHDVDHFMYSSDRGSRITWCMNTYLIAISFLIAIAWCGTHLYDRYLIAIAYLMALSIFIAISIVIITEYLISIALVIAYGVEYRSSLSFIVLQPKMERQFYTTIFDRQTDVMRLVRPFHQTFDVSDLSRARSFLLSWNGLKLYYIVILP